MDVCEQIEIVDVFKELEWEGFEEIIPPPQD